MTLTDERVVLANRLDAGYANSHYSHHDPKGTRGANCPACHENARANEDMHQAARFLRESAQREAELDVPCDEMEARDAMNALRTRAENAESANRAERAVWSRVMERLTGNGTYATSEIEPAIAAKDAEIANLTHEIIGLRESAVSGSEWGWHDCRNGKRVPYSWVFCNWGCTPERITPLSGPVKDRNDALADAEAEGFKRGVEAAAKVCDADAEKSRNAHYSGHTNQSWAAERCASAIRALLPPAPAAPEKHEFKCPPEAWTTGYGTPDCEVCGGPFGGPLHTPR